MPNRQTPRLLSDENGFSLIEATVAAGLLAASLVFLAQLCALAVRGNLESRSATYATGLAQQKLEQLQSLRWGFDQQGVPVRDTTTDTAVSPVQPTGGTGLSPSPSTSLRDNTPGFVDYIDRFGRTIGGGSAPPAETVYIRRWSIEPLSAAPDSALIVQVLVTRSVAVTTAQDRRGVLLSDARMVTVKSRQPW